MCLTIAPGALPRPFIDCDDLKDLDQLFDYVGRHTNMLVILCSKDILLRPWCVGEIVTANANGVPALKLILDDFTHPDATFIEKYGELVGDLSGLTERGISVPKIQIALGWLSSLTYVCLPSSLSKRSMQEIASSVVNGHRTSIAKGPKPSASVEITARPDIESEDQQTIILCDIENNESVATALILQMLLASRLAHKPELVPHVLGKRLPRVVKTLIIICTDGALQQPHIQSVLMVAGAQNAKYIPILGCDSFRFPTKNFLDGIRQGAMACATDEVEQLSRLIGEVFKSIAIVFEPQAYSSSEQVLAAKADAVAERCSKRHLLKTLAVEFSL